jgi:cystathionine beta-lyase/cystathionine gamma-synthase
MPMSRESDDPINLCSKPYAAPRQPTIAHAPPIYLSSVYRCASPEQANDILGGDEAGFVYARDGHPNGEMLAAKCRLLHAAERAVVASSGMAAMATALIAYSKTGDHLVVSEQLYGRSLLLLDAEAGRLGIRTTRADTCDLSAVQAALTGRTRLIVVETISNPTLRVCDIAALAELAERRGALLLVDNTFASPVLCRPHSLGAHLVLESLTKIMNGHSDVILGLLTGGGPHFDAAGWPRVTSVLSTWGWASSPFDCYLALRGLSTLAMRADCGSRNAMALAEWLAAQPAVDAVHYPGLASHADHALAQRQFGERFGAMLTFNLRGGIDAATAFIRGASDVPFCPSLGELSTTLSHPASTSHRALSVEQRAKLAITDGTIRLSVGVETIDYLRDALGAGLAAIR